MIIQTCSEEVIKHWPWAVKNEISISLFSTPHWHIWTTGKGIMFKCCLLTSLHTKLQAGGSGTQPISLQVALQLPDWQNPGSTDGHLSVSLPLNAGAPCCTRCTHLTPQLSGWPTTPWWWVHLEGIKNLQSWCFWMSVDQEDQPRHWWWTLVKAGEELPEPHC